MSEKCWGKIYKNNNRMLSFSAEVYKNESIEGAAIATQIAKKNFLNASSAKKWAEKQILNQQQSFIIKEYYVIRKD